MTGRIRWTEDAALAVWSGYVGTAAAQLFTIAAPLPGSGKGFLLMSHLPGMDFSCSRPRLEEAQAEAERWLEEFTASLGAVFPGGHPDGNAIEAYCATEAGDGDGRHLLQYAVRLPDGTTTAYGDQSWVKAGLGARDHAGASTVVRDIWVSYGPWRTHETSAPVAADSKEHR
jgi:hypothetical protein